MRIKENGWIGKCNEGVIPNEYNMYFKCEDNSIYVFAKGYLRKNKNETDIKYRIEKTVGDIRKNGICKASIPFVDNESFKRNLLQWTLSHITHTIQTTNLKDNEVDKYEIRN